MPTLENVDLFEVLGNVVNENTEYYKSDFEHDKRFLANAAHKENPEDKFFYWLSRSHGTHLLGEREVFIKDSPENTTFLYWNDVNNESIRAYAVTVTGEADGKIIGNVYDIDYPQLCEYIKENAAVADNKTMYYQNGSIEVAANNYDNIVSHAEYGRYVGYELIPNDPEYLKEMLKKVRTERGQETVENEQSEIEQTPDEQTTPDESVFNAIPPEKQNEIRESVKDTLQIFIDRDMEEYGKVTEGTMETLKTQSYTVQDGVAVRIEELENNTPEQETAADPADIEDSTDTAATETEQEQTETPDEANSRSLYYTINEAMAKRAKEMNSYSDYRQGSATASYRAEVDKAIEIAEWQKSRVDPQFHAKIDSLLATYCRKLADNINKGLEIETRCPSWLITGGSNFPVRKKEKQNAARETNWREYQDIQGLLDKIKSVGMGGISADDPNAIEKLESKLAKLEAYHQKVKTVNAYFRKHKTVEGCPVLTTAEIEAMTQTIHSERSMYKMPYPPYELQYNNAEMRRLKQRIEGLKSRDRTNFVGWEFDGGKVEPNKEDNRLQIYFDEKPSAEAREELKRNGFKWSPKNMVWQKQLKTNLYFQCDSIEFLKPLNDKKPSEILREANAPKKEQEQQTAEPPEQSESFIAKMLDNAEIEFTHFTSQEQYDKWVTEHGVPPTKANTKAQESETVNVDLYKEPTVTIVYTESWSFDDGQQLPFNIADEMFSKLDKTYFDDNKCCKTEYRIDFVLYGQESSYTGRFDFGSNQGDILKGIKSYHEFMINTPDIQKQFQELKVLDEIMQKSNFILDTFIPYMELHKSLSVMEQAAVEAVKTQDLPENDFLYYSAVSSYVANCRKELNTTDFKDFKLPEAPKREDFHKPTMDELKEKSKQGEQIAITDMIDSINADKQRAKAAKSAKTEKPSIVKRLADEKAKAKTTESPKRTTKKKNQDLEVN